MVDNHLKLLVLLLVSAVCVTQPLRADDDLPDLDMALGEDDFLFEEIPSVYSASKYEQKITQAPSSVSIVTADEIKRYGYRSAHRCRSARAVIQSISKPRVI